MEPAIFNKFRKIIFKESGISLGNEKVSLLANRISKRLRALKLSDETQYLKIIETDASGDELAELIDCVTTNVTYFWRESAHFDYVIAKCQEWSKTGKREVKIWSAASSSGEEPYSIAFCLSEHLDLKKCDAKILATDLCSKVLRHAIEGRYQEKQLKDVPDLYLKKYCSHENHKGLKMVSVDKRCKDLVVFRKFNLSTFPYPLKGPFDIIFCRNVMIYFEVELRARLVNEMSKLLSPGGALIIGHSENLLGIEHPLESVKSGIYVKPR